MARPLNANVEAAPNFIANLEAAHQFFILQDADSADTRLARLKEDLKEMVSVLQLYPAGGRPARFMAATSMQARLRLQAVLNLADQAGLPNLREYVVGRHIVLYAHAETEVVLLSIKHQRQLVYSADT
jgi:hypothetical protein